MAMKTFDEVKARIKELQMDESKFEEFLRDTYDDKSCDKKIEQHLWRIRREKEILSWVIDEPLLPF